MGLLSRKKPELPDAILASAARLSLNDANEYQRAQRRKKPWQDLAWNMFDELGEVKYPTNYLGNAMERLRLFVAERPDPEQDPEPAADQGVQDALARLDQGPGLAHLQREIGIHFTVPGECLLVGAMERPDTDEVWDVKSTDELVPNPEGKWLYKSEPDADPIQLSEDQKDLVFRMWQPHPRFGYLADSPLRGVLDACETLMAASQAIRAILLSRATSAGMLFLPSEATFASPDPTTDIPEGVDPMVYSIFRSMQNAIAQPGTAAATIPLVFKMQGEFLDKVKHIALDRPIDDKLIELVSNAVQRLAQGFNLPVEIVLGHQQTTFTNAAEVRLDTFKAHIEPLAIVMCNALRPYLRTELKARGNARANDYFVWYDPSKLVTKPDQTDDAKWAYEQRVIGVKAARKYLKFDDRDAPEEGEAGPPADGPMPDQTDEMQAPESLPASAAPRYSQIGPRLHAMDRELKLSLQVASDAAVKRVLERAGAHVRGRVRGDAEMRARLKDVDNQDVLAHLGPTKIAALGINVTQFTEGAFDKLRGQFDSWVEGVHTRSARLIPGMSQAEREVLTHKQERDRAQAWAVLEESLKAHTHERLYDPHPAPPKKGEFDGTTIVPHGLIRAAVAVAGGATGLNSARNRGIFAVATGPVVQNALADHGVEVTGFQWVYGEFPRTRPFEPHEALDQATFDNFDSEVLANDEDWPEVAYFTPGDHDGCFVAGTDVTAPLLGASTERSYTGEIVEVVTASGKHLTVTPNHPILTPQGWVAAGLLDESSYVVRCLDSERVAALMNPHDAHQPAPIEHVARSLGGSHRVLPASMETAAEDFHGDGKGSQVHVVRTNGLLWRGLDPEIGKHLPKPNLGGRNEDAPRLTGPSRTSKSLVGVATSSLGFEGMGGNGSALRGGAPTMQFALRFSGGATLHPSEDQTVLNRVAVDPVSLRQRLLGLASDVAVGHLLKGDGAGLLAADRVVRVHRSSFSGPVFNLHTSTNYYMAETVLVHNCQCDWMPLTQEIAIAASGEDAA